jgi:hypothetical protein
MRLMRGPLVAVFALAIMTGCTEDEPFEPPVAEPVDHTFIFEPHAETPAITSIGVAGGFEEEGGDNFWNPGHNPMTENADGTWQITMKLDPGSYQYKYVFNGDQWPGNMCADATWGNPPGGEIDPNVQECVDDGFGGANALLVID